MVWEHSFCTILITPRKNETFELGIWENGERNGIFGIFDENGKFKNAAKWDNGTKIKSKPEKYEETVKKFLKKFNQLKVKKHESILE